MKKIFIALMFVVTLTIVNTCAASDVWIEHWKAEGVDVYAMDDTIRGDTSDTGYKAFAVSTKLIKNGQVVEILNWKFSRFRTDMWRYETSNMDGRHTTVVIPRSPLFEFCMAQLGWSYRISDDNGIKYYH